MIKLITNHPAEEQRERGRKSKHQQKPARRLITRTTRTLLELDTLQVQDTQYVEWLDNRRMNWVICLMILFAIVFMGELASVDLYPAYRSSKLRLWPSFVVFGITISLLLFTEFATGVFKFNLFTSYPRIRSALFGVPASLSGEYTPQSIDIRGFRREWTTPSRDIIVDCLVRRLRHDLHGDSTQVLEAALTNMAWFISKNSTAGNQVPLDNLFFICVGLVLLRKDKRGLFLQNYVPAVLSLSREEVLEEARRVRTVLRTVR